MKNINLLGILLFVLTWQNARSQDSTKIKNILNQVNYGVPASPAFELLPNKPSEVTHLASVHDISASINNFVDGGKLKSGAAFDIRPFAYAAGSLKHYQKSGLSRVLWRSVFSLGTASESKNSSDVYIGAGLRIPIIDKSDPRSHADYVSNLEAAYYKAYNDLKNPPFGQTAAEHQKTVDEFAKSQDIKKLRDDFAKQYWNAFRWDVGIGASNRAASGFLKTDSLFKDRIGLWTAFGLPIPKGQLTISANTAWIKAKADTGETNRNVFGARARFFVASWLSASGEYAKIHSLRNTVSYNESWDHLAIVVEFKIPKLGGWFGLAYGGDSAHRTDTGTKFSFNYAIYTDNLIKN